jgi:hypothetical protein
MKVLKAAVLIILSFLSLVKSEDCVTLYKLEKETCGELCLSKYIASFAVKFGGVKEGNCKTQGYTVYDHKESVSVGPFGSFEVTIYKKETPPALEKFLQ